MDDKEFKNRVKKIAKKNKEIYQETRQGKGSHSRVYYGERFTTVKQGEISPGLLNEMCKQLGLTKAELMEA